MVGVQTYQSFKRIFAYSVNVSSERPPTQTAQAYFRYYFDQTVAPVITEIAPSDSDNIDSDVSIESDVSASAPFEPEISSEGDEASAITPELDTTEPSSATMLGRLKHGLMKTRRQLGQNILSLWSSDAEYEAALEDIESQLLISDVGVEATDQLMAPVRQLPQAALGDQAQIRDVLSSAMVSLLNVPAVSANPLKLEADKISDLPHKPFVVLVVGVNGVGKTTTIAKLAGRLLSANKRVLLAAGDTFRAAAIEQLSTWADRHQVPVVAQKPGADSASVIFDAVSSAQAKGIDVVLADTAGRLHNKQHLMDELTKVSRVLKKLDVAAPHMVLLVLDATTGQNAINQAQAFHQALPVSGLVLTKMDGTAKGGIAFALVDKLQLPIWYIGVGEQAQDLREFEAQSFVEALLSTE